MSAIRAFVLTTTVAILACSPAEQPAEGGQAAAPAGGMSAVRDETSQLDIVKVAAGSEDHTTLVAALRAAGLVDALANPGPFTVFAPTNAAFEKLPAGTVEDLLQPASKGKLTNILYHHVTTSALGLEFLSDGQSLWLVDGGHETITRKDGDTYIGDAKIVASVRASNGWVHVIDGVLVPGGN